MNKDNSIKSMIKLGLTLAIYAAVSCAVLAVVNNFTSVKIIQNQKNAADKAMKVVFETADSFEQVTDFEPSSVKTISIDAMYLAKKNGNVIGGTVQVTGPTYDQGTVIFGIDKDGIVTGMQVLKISDSPGFGTKAKDPGFKLSNGKTFFGQFAGKNARNGFVAGKTFDAISGATITSNGIAVLMKEGSASLLKYLANIN